jgi:hypothetical protein
MQTKHLTTPVKVAVLFALSGFYRENDSPIPSRLTPLDFWVHPFAPIRQTPHGQEFDLQFLEPEDVYAELIQLLTGTPYDNNKDLSYLVPITRNTAGGEFDLNTACSGMFRDMVLKGLATKRRRKPVYGTYIMDIHLVRVEQQHLDEGENEVTVEYQYSSANVTMSNPTWPTPWNKVLARDNAPIEDETAQGEVV